MHGKTAWRQWGQAGLGLLIVIVMVSACGFHPRGSNTELNDAGRLFIDADRDLSIDELLRTALRERAFVVADNRDAADIVLRVADETQSQRIVSVRSTGRVSEYELAHAVMLTISRAGDPLADAGNDPVDADADADADTDTDTDANANGGSNASGAADGVRAEQTSVGRTADRVRVTREYTYDEAQVLGKENEARILQAELRDELVRQIVLRTVASLARTGAAVDYQ